MKDFLENLELGESKYKLSSDEIKSILKEHGIYVNKETEKVETKYKDELQDNKTTIANLKEQIDNAPKTEDIENLNKIIADYEQKDADREAREKAKMEDDILTKNINEVFGDRKFTSEYARNGLLNDIKEGLNKPENKGKGIQVLFDELTKDKNDIFANPNQMKDMEGMGDSEQENIKEIPTLW